MFKECQKCNDILMDLYIPAMLGMDCFTPFNLERTKLYCTVYKRKGAYSCKTAFPEPYPVQKRSLSAKNKTRGEETLQIWANIRLFAM